MSALCALFDNRSAAGTPSLAALLSLPDAATVPALSIFTNPTLDAQNYVDLSFTYDFGDKAEIHAGVNNLFDKDPPIIAGQGGYGNT